MFGAQSSVSGYIYMMITKLQPYSDAVRQFKDLKPDQTTGILGQFIPKAPLPPSPTPNSTVG